MREERRRKRRRGAGGRWGGAALGGREGSWILGTLGKGSTFPIIFKVIFYLVVIKNMIQKQAGSRTKARHAHIPQRQSQGHRGVCLHGHPGSRPGSPPGSSPLPPPTEGPSVSSHPVITCIYEFINS